METDGIKLKNSNWSFKNEDTAENFDDHVKKSIPFYSEGQKLIVSLSDFFISDNSKIVDIGCSTGNLTFQLSERNKEKKPKIFGIDNSESMINIAKKRNQNEDCVFLYQDIMDFDLSDADFVVSYYTIQFIKPHQRQELINQIYNSLRWGGAFLFFEKTRANDARFQDIITSLYFEFKQEQGFNDQEILGKFMSLKGILEPFSTEGNFQLLKRAGFQDVLTVFKYVPFEGFLCIK